MCVYCPERFEEMNKEGMGMKVADVLSLLGEETDANELSTWLWIPV